MERQGECPVFISWGSLQTAYNDQGGSKQGPDWDNIVQTGEKEYVASPLKEGLDYYLPLGYWNENFVWV